MHDDQRLDRVWRGSGLHQRPLRVPDLGDCSGRCTIAQTCVNGACLATCTTDKTCGASNVPGRRVPRRHPSAALLHDGFECSAASVCHNGACRLACPDEQHDLQPRRRDQHLRERQRALLLGEQNEQRPQCARTADCATMGLAGRECVNARCI
ncbi:MAG: hypothetical protein IPF99_35540 [Deltaproteobacteria bacterium]|nr:hypothetical protein [Deltaproteobacteria bacterium]